MDAFDLEGRNLAGSGSGDVGTERRRNVRLLSELGGGLALGQFDQVGPIGLPGLLDVDLGIGLQVVIPVRVLGCADGKVDAAAVVTGTVGLEGVDAKIIIDPRSSAATPTLR